MDEQNFSSKTAQVGDPVLCHLGPLNTFGHSVFPRGAMLSGHLAESKDPGHFVGKGWLQLEFDRIILPNAEVMPLSAKIIAAPHLKTDKEGKLHGGGHPTRDTVEWMIPVLWPIKILTLPARGPYPALKGESRLTMRLMEDVIVPLPAPSRAAVPSPPWAMPTSYIPSPYGLMRPASMVTREAAPQVRTVADSETTLPGRALLADSRSLIEPAMQEVGQPTESPAVPPPGNSNPGFSTVIVLKGGSAFLSREYWVQGGEIECVSGDGQQRAFPLEAIDLDQTIHVNRERNVEFVLRSKTGVLEQ